MQISDYKYIIGTEKRDRYYAIPELNRLKPSIQQFIDLANLDITLTVPTAFLYINGFSLSPSDSSLNPVDIKNYMPVIKGGSSYIAHEWISTFQNKELITHVDILSGTCAAGIQAMYEAKRLFNEKKVKEVIIIGTERTSPDTLRLFKELRIPVTCGDGFVYMRLLDSGDDISDVKWKFAHNKNPFEFTQEQINSLIPAYAVDWVKLHGTGTKANTHAEKEISKLGYVLTYKESIGHTQGISAMLETALVLDCNRITGKILVTANGLGGFYGAFTLHKS